MNYYEGNGALWLIPTLPALTALIIFCFSKKMTGATAARIAIGGIGLSFAVVLFASATLWSMPSRYNAEPQNVPVAEVLAGSAAELPDRMNPVLTQRMWRWLDAGFVRADAGFWFDRLTMVFTLIITGVGLLIHIYSSGYMRGDEGERRYFGFLNLFVAAMLVLVMADNAFFMLLGWEGVGLCSFALIGHWYQQRENAMAALKAFLVTRFGDVFLILGILLLAKVATVSFYEFHSGRVGFAALALEMSAGTGVLTGRTMVLIAGLLLLGGVAGKSAQIPLQNWLPDAMAGPTPVSALIHAATMVTAGVYLIARFHNLFFQHEGLMAIVALMGVATALYGASAAIVQTDIKRVLAYSTISQIGYMVLGLGVGAFAAGVFHFFTHAFYKALLFLAAGTVIHALHGEQNIFAMGGLRGRLASRKGARDWTFMAFVVGAAALAGFPLTSGFFSKDAILWSALASGRPLWWLIYPLALFTSFLTAIYAFRLVFIVFFGEPRKADLHVHAPEPVLVFPLVILAFFALVAGFLNIPHLLQWEHFMQPVVGEPHLQPWAGLGLELLVMLISVVVALAGIFVAWTLFGPRATRVIPEPTAEPAQIVTATPAPYRSRVASAAFHGWKVDPFYLRAFARPYQWVSGTIEWFDRQIVTGLYDLGAMTVRGLHKGVVEFQNGRTSRYALVMLFGAAAIILLVIIPQIFVPAGN